MSNALMAAETKKVLRGYCIKPIHSVNLDKETLYYLEPHGTGSYFVSRFPSAKRSQMGVYQKGRFSIIREETVKISNTNEENKIKDQTEIAINKDVKSKDTVKNPEILAKGNCILQEDLISGVIYKADLVYDPKGNTLPEPVQSYYVLKISKGEPYYNEHSCYYYEDLELSNLKGGCSVKRFENFVEVGAAPVSKKTSRKKQTLSNFKVNIQDINSEDTKVLVDNKGVDSTKAEHTTAPVEKLEVLENKSSQSSILAASSIPEQKINKRKPKRKEVNGEQITFDNLL